MRRALIATLMLLAPTLAVAGPREDVLTSTIRCGAITDDRQWLDCYYGAAQPMRRQLNLPPAPEAQTRLVPVTTGIAPPLPQAQLASVTAPAMVQAPAPRKGRDGILYDVIGGKVLVSKMPAQSYSFDNGGAFIMTLQDGEVWRQSPGDEHLAKWKKPAADYRVTIREGALGSVQLEVQGDPHIYKVKRLR